MRSYYVIYYADWFWFFTVVCLRKNYPFESILIYKISMQCLKHFSFYEEAVLLNWSTAPPWCMILLWSWFLIYCSEQCLLSCFIAQLYCSQNTQINHRWSIRHALLQSESMCYCCVWVGLDTGNNVACCSFILCNNVSLLGDIVVSRSHDIPSFLIKTAFCSLLNGHWGIVFFVSAIHKSFLLWDVFKQDLIPNRQWRDSCFPATKVPNILHVIHCS